MTVGGPTTAAPTLAARRVLVVAGELPPGPGGIGSHAYAVACEVARQGRDVHLVGSQHYVDDEARRRFIEASPVPIRRLPDGRRAPITAAARGREIREAIREVGPDVVVATGGRVLWLTAPLARRTGVPMVAVVHGTELCGPSWSRRLTRRALDAATSVVAVSEFTAGLARDLGVSRPIEVVPNGAEADRFAPSEELRARFRARHGLGDRPVVLTVGNVTERKGQHVVVEALPRVVAEVPEVAYVVVGRPTEADALRDQARRLGVADHLVVVGQVTGDEVVDAHAAADVFAMTSTTTGTGDVEGYGIAVVEAALSGVPAVVTRHTGAEEAVRHGETGLAVESDPASVAGALVGLLTDDETRRAMGQAAEDEARRTGSWAHRATRYGEVLDQVVGGRRPRIVVVSHTEHHRRDDGTLVGFGPTLRELDQLATLASELVHVVPLHPGPPPGNALEPQAPNLRTVTVPAAGGSTLASKALAVAQIPRWAATIRHELATADVAHVRCPAGISMVALLILAVRRRPRDRWVKYAGNWAPDHRDAATYRLQRWWLRRGLARASVTVNGRWPDQPTFVRAFDNPTLTDAEMQAGRRAAAERPPGPPHRMVLVGRLEEAKGVRTAVTTASELRDRGWDVTLDLVGDGPLRPWVEAQVATRDDGAIRLHGWLPRPRVEDVLAASHLMLFPTTASEGFPKAVGEALAFGCVPVTSGISSMGQVLRETGGAVVVEPGTSWADAVEGLLSGPELGALASVGVEAAGRFSYATYLERVHTMAMEDWDRRL